MDSMKTPKRDFPPKVATQMLEGTNHLYVNNQEIGRNRIVSVDRSDVGVENNQPVLWQTTHGSPYILL